MAASTPKPIAAVRALSGRSCRIQPAGYTTTTRPRQSSTSGNAAADVANPHRRAVAISHDHILERLRLDDLVVDIDRQARPRGGERALRSIGGRFDESVTQLLQSEAARRELGRIDLNADCRA